MRLKMSGNMGFRHEMLKDWVGVLGILENLLRFLNGIESYFCGNYDFWW